MPEKDANQRPPQGFATATTSPYSVLWLNRSIRDQSPTRDVNKGGLTLSRTLAASVGQPTTLDKNFCNFRLAIVAKICAPGEFTVPALTGKLRVSRHAAYRHHCPGPSAIWDIAPESGNCTTLYSRPNDGSNLYTPAFWGTSCLKDLRLR